jgi:hypothetical protein
VLSLKERIELLEADLKAVPQRISVYQDLPFAILRHDPGDEWEMRRESRLLATRLEQTGRRVQFISLADLLWEAIDTTEGLDAVVELEREQGFEAAQEQLTIYLSDPDWRPLPELLAERLRPLDPRRDVAFLVRAAAMGPAIYQMSKLLEQMQGRTEVTTLLFYPGTIEGTTGLRFLDLDGREGLGNYRVKIYG